MTLARLQRAALGLTLASLSLALPPAARAADDAPDDPKIKARRAVAQLLSGNPAKREQAKKDLIALGADARAAVRAAAESDEPELRARAAEVLLRLPWYLPHDSPGVQNLLRNYGVLTVEQRKDVIRQLADLTNHGYGAMARLIAEEPSDDVKWRIVAAIRRVFRDKLLDSFRELDTTAGASAPVLAAAGHAWMPKDVAKATGLLRAALDADERQPANDAGEIAAAYDRLQNLALLAADYDEVARLLRRHARRGGFDEDGEATRPVLALFAAHAKFGPLAGFDDDVKTYAAQFDDPRMVYALGKAYERAGQRAVADAAFRAAFAADLVDIEARLGRSGEFLMRHNWLDLAEQQFAAVFDLSAEHSGARQQMPPELDDANAHFRLSQVAAAREDDAAAAEHMRKAIDLHFKAQGQLRGATEVGIQQDIDWHLLRAARARGDKAEVAKRLDALAASLTTAPANPDIANDVVPLLRAAGRGAEATALFDRVYKGIEEQWGTMLDHPTPKNNLAWLSARCGERKADALRLAVEATTMMPDNAAFLDTLAEAHFQNGNYAEAAKIERKVVAARPGDRFLQGQLHRFEAAAAKAGAKD